MPTLYCPKCGYNLTALTENRCPECGAGYEPDKIIALQREGISNRSVILQLVFTPAGLAVLAPMCLVGMVSSRNDFVIVILPSLFIFGLILLHALNLARAFVRTKKIRDGGDNTAWVFRGIWPCCILFTVIEVVLILGYFFGGCAVMIIGLSIY